MDGRLAFSISACLSVSRCTPLSLVLPHTHACTLAAASNAGVPWQRRSHTTTNNKPHTDHSVADRPTRSTDCPLTHTVSLAVPPSLSSSHILTRALWQPLLTLEYLGNGAATQQQTTNPTQITVSQTDLSGRRCALFSGSVCVFGSVTFALCGRDCRSVTLEVCVGGAPVCACL